MPTPLEMDDAITQAAHSLGIYDCYRVPVIEINERELPAAYFRRAPDRKAIRRALEDGQQIPGVRVTSDVEYFLRKRDEPQEAARIAEAISEPATRTTRRKAHQPGNT